MTQHNLQFSLIAHDDHSQEQQLVNKIIDSAPVTYIQISKVLENLFSSGGEILVSKTKINFFEDKWNFQGEMPEKYSSPDVYIYSFTKIHEISSYYTALSKLFALDSILKNGVHSRANNNDIKIVKNYLIYLYETKIEIIELSSEKSLYGYFSQLKIKETTKIKYKRALKKLYLFYQYSTGFEFSNNIYNFLNQYNVTLSQLEIRGSKLPLLPTEFMSKLTAKLYDFAKDNTQNKKRRKKAGLLYIETQTGLRPSEIVLLKRGCLISFDIDGLVGYKLQYTSTKNNYNSGKYECAETIATQKVVEIIKLLESFDNEKYISDNINPAQLNVFLNNFVFKNAAELNCITAGINNQYAGKHIYNGQYYINIPLQKQFRVYFATELRQRGYSDMAVAALLNHHDEKMLDYYGRDISDIQENPSFSAEIFREVLVDDADIIGSKANVYTNEIKSFIKNRNVKVEEDLNAIINDLAKEMPIRQKLGGCCIKANPHRLCEHDADTDELLCAYGECANQVHFYYNLPYYMVQFESSIAIYNHNKKQKYKQQAQKELYKLHNLINEKILPEISSLKKFLKSKGKDQIIKEHPEMSKIISNLNDIEKEVAEWKTKS